MTQIKRFNIFQFLLLFIALFSSVQVFAQWTVYPTTNTANLRKVDFFNSNAGMAAGDAIAVTTNSGASWTFSAAPFTVHDVCMTGTSSAVVVGHNAAGAGTIGRTTDPGLT